MAFPNSEAGLYEAGYRFKNRGSCRDCHAEIEWWDTPKGRHIPLDAGTLKPHWSTCPNAKDFRQANPGP